MRNKGVAVVLSIITTPLCLYYLPFSFVSRKVVVLSHSGEGATHLSGNDRTQLNVTFRTLSGQFEVFRMNLNGPSDFIMAVGADVSDEELFDSIGKYYITTRVGYSATSRARNYLDYRGDVLPLFAQLTLIPSKHNQ